MIVIMLETLFSVCKSLPGNKHRSLEAGTFLFHQGDAVESLFLVLTGEVTLVRHQSDGSSITLQRAGATSILAEASLYSDYYHCHAIVNQTARICVLPKQEVFARLQSDSKFSRDWIMYLAREVQQARFRSELLSLKTVKARLDAWLNWQGDSLPPRGEWKALAGQLGVSPEALYRELAHRNKYMTPSPHSAE